MKRFCRLISDYMGVLVLLSALAALLFPGTIGHLKPRLINPLHFAAYPLATIPGALFSVWHNISGAIVAKLYSGKA